jgi:hypothetical protein
MGWRRDEVWFETDWLWFREQQRRPFAALALELPAFAADWLDAPLSAPIATGIEASRQRRLAKQAARRRRLATRTVPAVALVLGSATMLPVAALRNGGGQGAGPLQEDPPSLTFRLDVGRLGVREWPPAPKQAPARKLAARKSAPVKEFADVEWHRASSVGVWYSGRLFDGTQLPVEGPDWVTWNPNTDSVPNLRHRLYGNERTIRAIVSVLAAHRKAHPDAPRVLVGDISLRGGGSMDQHVSHQNGLDVDVYYPRLDRYLSAPIAAGQIDRELSQDLLDRFLAAGARTVFVGYATGLHGPSGVVVPYPNHENHMHVRFAPPGG